MLKKYIRNKHREPIGVVIAEQWGDRIVIGWSRCNKKDKFDREQAQEIAQARLDLIKTGKREVKIIHSVVPHVEEMATKSSKYFKGASLHPVIEKWLSEEME